MSWSVITKGQPHELKWRSSYSRCVDILYHFDKRSGCLLVRLNVVDDTICYLLVLMTQLHRLSCCISTRHEPTPQVILLHLHQCWRSWPPPPLAWAAFCAQTTIVCQTSEDSAGPWSSVPAPINIHLFSTTCSSRCSRGRPRRGRPRWSSRRGGCRIGCSRWCVHHCPCRQS